MSRISTAAQTQDHRAWLALAAGSDREHGGNDGYDDVPSTHYSWDSTVPHFRDISVGDRIVVWNKAVLLGASVIEEIVSAKDEKTLYTCPTCRRAKIKFRKRMTPRYKCYICHAEFEHADEDVVPVTTYRSTHDAGWVALSGALTGDQLRQLCVRPLAQHSFRSLRWNDFRVAVRNSPLGEPLDNLDFTAARIHGGHSRATVRVRIGQAAFRNRLIGEMGAICAFTGRAPAQALEAGHLYSYAGVGEHHQFGGLLFRRDIHRLFDAGFLAVNPRTLKIDVREDLGSYPTYTCLHGLPLAVPLRPEHVAWLDRHWVQHRTPIALVGGGTRGGA